MLQFYLICDSEDCYWMSWGDLWKVTGIYPSTLTNVYFAEQDWVL